MPNIASVLKQEITRLAAKEVRIAINPLRKEKVALKKAVRDLRARVDLLEQEAQLLKAEQDRSKKLVIGALPAKELAIRITAKGMRSMRKKLRLTQTEFATLLGVSTPAVSQWEKKTGALKVRDETKKAIFGVRDLGAREARRRLDGMPKPEAKMAKAAKPAKRRKMSAAGIARIRAGVKARWAKVRAEKAKSQGAK